MGFDDMAEGLHKSRGGLIRAFLSLEDGRISELVFSGDFILTPERYIEEMESCLLGAKPDRDEILSRLNRFFSNNSFQAPGSSPEDFAEAVLKAALKWKS